MEQKLKADLSRTAILEAAVHEFGTKPFEKASINQICRDGNITKGRLYYYFESKDQLYVAAEDYCLSLLGDKLLAFTPDPDKSMEDNILPGTITATVSAVALGISVPLVMWQPDDNISISFAVNAADMYNRKLLEAIKTGNNTR